MVIIFSIHHAISTIYEIAEGSGTSCRTSMRTSVCEEFDWFAEGMWAENEKSETS